MRPTTIYGCREGRGRAAVRLLRAALRPGRSWGALPGRDQQRSGAGRGGTTDYAVEMFYAALGSGSYACFVRDDTVLPMIYMPDCIKAALDLMDADPAKLMHHNAFNLASMSFSAGALAGEIRKHVPGFICTFEPDERQAIADSWPMSLDDSAARREWGWQPRFDLPGMTLDMLNRLEARNGRQ